MSLSNQFNSLYPSLPTKRVHPKINSFLKEADLDIKVYRVNNHYAVRYLNGLVYNFYTSDYADYATQRALELADKYIRNQD